MSHEKRVFQCDCDARVRRGVEIICTDREGESGERERGEREGGSERQRDRDRGRRGFKKLEIHNFRICHFLFPCDSPAIKSPVCSDSQATNQPFPFFVNPLSLF
jgi:hypothetical protein